ncbi:hypothetical protein FQB35_07270 [Crassaminicella thermophila]|uniref:Uncharacterized protein n=1 Tax=Crassaminicella thermophila TaxID=2599308 RepID=A0A5C0SGU9_CRATE|nr:hypothetical protein [Crassaminicella thermophila]QEK12189.1 hypothetical protein FQB35_07270 [Crassaminicella thermophila]
MIQIDDSGSGSLIGGTCIGAMRKETEEYVYDIIPLEYYHSDNFEKKLYLDVVVDITNSLLQKLKVSKHEKIEVCRGYMFDKLRLFLKENKYNFSSTTIGEPLQSRIENTFEEYSISLGLPNEFLSYTKYPFHFHRLLRWVYADYNNRFPLCKTGWKSWKKYGNIKLKVETTYIKHSKYKCLKCWNKIENESYVKVLKYYSNKPNIIYLHLDC